MPSLWGALLWLLPVGCAPQSAPESVRRTSRPSDQVDSSLPRESAESVPASVDSCDVVVVGAGISGLGAALDLARGSARVTVVDMSSVFGGHAVMSQGSVSIVASPMQQALGIADSPELAFQDFHTWGEDPATDWVRHYFDNSRVEIYDWLTELGVRFATVVGSSGNTSGMQPQVRFPDDS